MTAILLIALFILANLVAAGTMLSLGHIWQFVAPESVSVWPWMLIGITGVLASIGTIQLLGVK